MNPIRFFLAACVCALLFWNDVAAQSQPRVQLRFDEARRDTVDDPHRPTVGLSDTVGARPFACKLNRRRATCEAVYDAVTLWNVRRVRIKNRRMRLTDSTGREKVKLLKFFIERNGRKGVRPHLLGNVSGYMWSSGVRENGRWRKVAPYIDRYTLRSECDSARLAGNGKAFRVPDELWHTLPREARYELNGTTVPGGLFQFIDGLILRTLDIRDAGGGEWVVQGETFPDRIPLVIYEGSRSSIESWFALCRSGAFSTGAEFEMRYYYLPPLEAVQTFGREGLYGAICIEYAE